ncbi:hypothetical protein SGLAM104S_04374 [Streptomyces glaucescens]
MTISAAPRVFRSAGLSWPVRPTAFTVCNDGTTLKYRPARVDVGHPHGVVAPLRGVHQPPARSTDATMGPATSPPRPPCCTMAAAATSSR